MKRLLPALLPLLLLSASLAGDAASETVKHLGPSSTWLRARLTLEDVPPLGKGVSIAVEGSGRCLIREIDQIQKTERRFELTLEREESLSLFALTADKDLLATPALKPPAPGEERASLALENALGITREVAKGPLDKAPGFAEVAAALHALEKKKEDKTPSYSGKYEPFFRAFEGVSVTLSIYSGRQDPVFELTAPEDWLVIEKALSDLPETEPPKRQGPPGLGYRGLLLNPRGLPALPRWVSVYKGALGLGEDPRHVTHKKDAKGLEPWLLDEAKKRGFEIPK
jgi:hypothetical protein